ncbi:MAG: hypothetical protein LBT54_05130, partial [Bifidobacteriaceae bacterium]|nr:hypothetical protein [Bifidobacteriaceae bacterium]
DLEFEAVLGDGAVPGGATGAEIANLVFGPSDPSRPDPPACSQDAGPVDPATHEPRAVDRFRPAPVSELAKTSTADAETRIGDTVTYTVSATNAGPVPFTRDSPAVVRDSLAGAIGDSDYQADASDNGAGGPGTDAPACPAGPGADPETGEPCAAVAHGLPRLAVAKTSDAGPGPRPGDRVRFQVEVRNTGIAPFTADGPARVGNVAWAGPGEPAGGLDPPDCAGRPDCAVVGPELPRHELAKRAAPAAATTVGQAVRFSVTARSAGPGAYTEAHPAEVVDHMADVLDDAALVPGSLTATVGGRSAGRVVLDGPETPRWTGPLAAGAEVLVEYAVVYSGGRNRRLANSACAADGGARARVRVGAHQDGCGGFQDPRKRHGGRPPPPRPRLTLAAPQPRARQGSGTALWVAALAVGRRGEVQFPLSNHSHQWRIDSEPRCQGMDGFAKIRDGRHDRDPFGELEAHSFGECDGLAQRVRHLDLG